ncbi:MAG: isoleucine--tRNA ligase [Mycobacteriales bacterium]
MTFPPMPPTVDFPAVEREVLARWATDQVFRRSMEQTAGGPLWVFYEGPPTANGTPGAHHVEARAFKDLFCRYRTMKGFAVPRRAGWDCHGLPVELAVEKELGFTNKQDIESYGIAAFNVRCRESVLRHVGEFERMSERMGYWLDYAAAYRTMDPQYIESVWWSLQVIAEKGLLVEDHRVSPYCPRCQTALSDHEVAQGYTEVVDPSVYVRFPILDGPFADHEASLLVWTTTPWTLVSNTAVAVHPDVTYVAARTGSGEVLVVAEELADAALGAGAQVLDRVTGRALEHTRYRAPFALVAVPEPAHFVVLADYVTTEDGTGLVHQAPAFGAEDMAVAREYGLSVINPVRADGRFEAGLPLIGGQFFKAADPVLVDDLRERGLLLRDLPYRHNYPLCWRCDTPLLYYALPSWYVRTTAIKDRLLAENARTDWHPPTIRDGRFGDWLANNVDWALSRNRYWGTPLPVWRCPDGHLEVIGSLRELGELAGRDLADLDPHRPFVDEITFPCRHDASLMRRVPEVIDCWYDAGAMPFAQWGAPHRGEESFQASYPAQYIAEAIDQTRGWFYTLMAIGTAVFDRSSYEAVLCLGHIVDADGRKMSKHLGNVLDPLELFEQHGADAVRWLMLATGNPWTTRRVGHAALDEVVRKVLLTYWNSASFLVLYANAAGWSPDRRGGTERLLDRWLRSELHASIAEVDQALESFDSVRAGRRIAALLDDLSNWYVRRNRRRFWDGDPAAFAALHEALVAVTGLLAPFVPFVTDEIWCILGGPGDSVHLSSFPVVDPDLIDSDLAGAVALARRLVELGRAARANSGVRTRQPLARALVSAAALAAMPAELQRDVADELNVGELAPLTGQLTDLAVKPNFRALGRRFGSLTQEAARQVGPDRFDRASGTLRVQLPDGEAVLSGDELLVTETPREGWVVATGDGHTVALDLALTPQLRRAGLAREVTRQIQDGRKRSALQVSDRIELWWQADGAELAAAIAEQEALIAREVLAVSCTQGRPAAPLAPHHDPDLGLTFWLRAAGE